MAYPHHDLPAFAEESSQPEDERRPGQLAEDRQDEEFRSIHACEARRQRDEGPHHGQHPAEEDGLEAIAVKPVLGEIHMGFLDEGRKL